MSVSWIHTNDLHGRLDDVRFEKLAELRNSVNLFFDTGDAISTGNLGVPLRRDPVWTKLATLRCTASVPGNRESHLIESVFRAKLAGATHPILCANLFARDGSRPLPPSLVVNVGDVKVGIVGAMVEMVTRKMNSQAASAYLWEPAVPALVNLGRELRAEVDVLVALTHIGHRRDVELAETGIYDVILGGHSHTVLSEPELIGQTWICQGGSHGRFVGRYLWQDGRLTGELLGL